MKFGEFFKKLQNFSETSKKVILFCVVGLIAAVLVYFWFNSAIQKVNNIKTSGMPFLNLPNLDINKVASQIAKQNITPPSENSPATTQITQDQTKDWNIYTNTKYAFELKYPKNWDFTKYDSGAYFFPKGSEDGQVINIGFYKRGENYCKINFEDYVKVAAPLEIQNFESLNTLEKGANLNGIDMYATTWNYREINGREKISLPIVYIQTSVDTCGSLEMFLNDHAYLDIFNQIISTFKFTNK
jgi:hypothetical protein